MLNEEILIQITADLLSPGEINTEEEKENYVISVLGKNNKKILK